MYKMPNNAIQCHHSKKSRAAPFKRDRTANLEPKNGAGSQGLIQKALPLPGTLCLQSNGWCTVLKRREFCYADE